MQIMESFDPLASLMKVADSIRKEIAEIDAKEESTTDPEKTEILASKRSEKEGVLRSLVSVAKTHSALKKEKEAVEGALQEESTLMSKLASSSIIAKSSHSSLKSTSVISLKSKREDMKAFADPISTVDVNMKKIDDFCKAETKTLDTKIAALQNELSGYEELLALAKKDLASLKPAEVAKLDKIKTISSDLKSLKSKKAEFESKMDNAILNSVEHYLGAYDKIATQQAVNRIIEENKISKRVDLCFLVDATFSMDPWIDMTRAKVRDIITEVQNVYRDCKFRLAVVAYRDFDMKAASFNVQPFTEDPRTIQNFLDSLEVRGGGDGPEDINGGFQRLLRDLEWQSMSKVLIHFADAPCHGAEFNDGGDDHPNPPSDIKWETILREVKSLGMDYNFMKINNSTDKMTDKFRDLWQICGHLYVGNTLKKVEFKVHPINTNASHFVNTIKSSILESIRKSVSYMRTGASTRPHVLKGLQVDAIIEEEGENHFGAPEWTLPSSMWTHKNGKITSVAMHPIDQILKNGFKTLVGDCELQVQNKPFAHGAFNHAYAAKLVKTNHKIVAKRPEKVDTNLENLLKLDLKKKGLAIILAQDFNKELKKAKGFEWARLFFVHTFLFECSGELWLLEGYIDGDFTKYTNNLDEIDKTKEIRHFTAFAHYTYQRTRGEYLVTDFQGVGSFLLTDPALHSRTGEFNESGDFGIEGFVRFFDKHQCNDICKALGLKRPNLPEISGEKWDEKPHHHDPSMLKKKCRAKLCNKELEKSDKRYCKFCIEPMTQTTTKECNKCHKEFTYKPNYYLLEALHEPNRCPTCGKKKRRGLADLFEAEDESD